MDKITEAEKFVACSRGGRHGGKGSHAFKRPGGSGSGGRRDFAFNKPGEKDDVKDRYGRDSRDYIRKRGSDYERNGGRDGWRKSGYERRNDDESRKNERINKEDKERRNENECDKKKDLKRSDIRIEASSSSSSSSDDESPPSTNITKTTETKVATVEVNKPTPEEKNKLASRILKAEIMGNAGLVKELKIQMEMANQVVENEEGKSEKDSESGRNGSSEMLMVVDRQGGTRPFEGGEEIVDGRRKRKAVKADTHEDGKRVRYFHDDDHHSLQSLINQEKQTTSQHDQLAFVRLSGKKWINNVEDESVDEECLQKQPTTSYIHSRTKQMAIIEQRRLGHKLDSCVYCFDNCLKHLVISIARKVYLSLPSHRSMVEGHCVIAPLMHVTQSTVCDEDVLEEIIVSSHFCKYYTCVFVWR